MSLSVDNNVFSNWKNCAWSPAILNFFKKGLFFSYNFMWQFNVPSCCQSYAVGGGGSLIINPVYIGVIQLSMISRKTGKSIHRQIVFDYACIQTWYFIQFHTDKSVDSYVQIRTRYVYGQKWQKSQKNSRVRGALIKTYSNCSIQALFLI